MKLYLNRLQEYFPELTSGQLSKFEKLTGLYEEWNSQINVISRKDMESFLLHHVIHSLGIAKVMKFKPQTNVLDLGTGGGFPGIPLAIMFPETNFHLVDSIGKKIKVVNAVAEALELKNVKGEHERAEKLRNHYDFVVSRAVAHIEDFIPWVDNKFERNWFNDLPNGILYLKGGDLSEEFKNVKQKHKIYSLNKYFEEEFFETKKLVHVQMIKA